MATEFGVSMSDRNVFRAIYLIIAHLADPRTLRTVAYSHFVLNPS